MKEGIELDGFYQLSKEIGDYDGKIQNIYIL